MARINSLAASVCVFIFTTMLTAGCQQTATQPTPPQSQKDTPPNYKVKIRKQDPQNPFGKNGQIVEKNLINIVMDKKEIKVNGVVIHGPEELKKILKKSSAPVITVATHKCLSSQSAAEILTIAQDHTDTPIAYSSFGSYDDPQCQ